MSSEHHDKKKEHDHKDEKDDKDEKDQEKAARHAEQESKSASGRGREDLGK